MTEENFLRYRLEIVQGMGHGPFRAALLTAILARMEVLPQKATRTTLVRTYPPPPPGRTPGY